MKLFRYLCLSVCLSLCLTIADAGSQSRPHAAIGGVIGVGYFDDGDTAFDFSNGVLNGAAISAAGGVYDVLFASPEPDANYTIQVSLGTAPRSYYIDSPHKDVTGFRLSVFDPTTGLPVGSDFIQVSLVRLSQ